MSVVPSGESARISATMCYSATTRYAGRRQCTSETRSSFGNPSIVPTAASRSAGVHVRWTIAATSGHGMASPGDSALRILDLCEHPRRIGARNQRGVTEAHRHTIAKELPHSRKGEVVERHAHIEGERKCVGSPTSRESSRQ